MAAAAKKKTVKKSKSRKKTSGFRFFVFGMNCALCFLLAVLILYELFHINNMPLPIEPLAPAPIRHESIYGSRRIVAEEDYIAAALEVDEMQENDAFSVENTLNRTETAVVPIDSWEQKVAYINRIELPEEDVYNFYEEKLPEDINENQTENFPGGFVPVHKPKYEEPLPRIAIVIDDMGISHRRTRDISSLDYPLTASFLTYATELPSQIAASHAAGQEIMAHLPMEPLVSMNVSPDVLTVKMTEAQVHDGIVKMLDKFPGIKGVNNHMGSRFTEDAKRLGVVMRELKKRRLFFLDSKTTPHSAGLDAARKAGVKYVARNVFLDNKDDFDYIIGQLKQVERIARQNGYAIAIGHPKAQTYLALKAWLPHLPEKGIRLVHLSEIVQ